MPDVTRGSSSEFMNATEQEQHGVAFSIATHVHVNTVSGRRPSPKEVRAEIIRQLTSHENDDGCITFEVMFHDDTRNDREPRDLWIREYDESEL